MYIWMPNAFTGWGSDVHDKPYPVLFCTAFNQRTEKRPGLLIHVNGHNINSVWH